MDDGCKCVSKHHAADVDDNLYEATLYPGEH